MILQNKTLEKDVASAEEDTAMIKGVNHDLRIELEDAKVTRDLAVMQKEELSTENDALQAQVRSSSVPLLPFSFLHLF